MLKGDGEKQQDVPYSPPPPPPPHLFFKLFFILRIVSIGGKQMNTRRVVRAGAGRKEKADL